MQKLKVNDNVIVTAGKDKGKTGTVKKIFEKRKRVLVEGVNMVKKAIKPTQERPDGGLVEMEMTIHRSNIGVVSPKDGKATRVKIDIKDGKKVRVATRCGSVLE